MNQADETQANLAFVALRQEPFLVEEFEYLANQIEDLHGVRLELEARCSCTVCTSQINLQSNIFELPGKK